MATRYRIWQITLSLLFGILFGSCQRASYHFEALVAAAPPAARLTAAAAPVCCPSAMVVAPSVAAPGRVSGARRLAVAALFRPLVRRQHRTAARLAGPANYQPATGRQGPRAGRTAPAAPGPVRHRGVAFGLAVVLGLFGAHQFYVGDNRRGMTYLFITLACVGLGLAAIPIANLAAFGGGLGGALVAIYLLLMALIGLIWVYLHALFDGIRMLIGADESVGVNGKKYRF